ncbi:hypothetical protein IV203_037798 [Nitzschia inconspicua]|uniref:Uncharacterized protein n=1 Tax=Nitzschia inconspicua TaxID=303405 RepID=A0A9K3LPM3_9STRA|nr:hypothetical protein IV203_005855 [Nitzschia inconspicua]KAG7364596.1 hypothetical protein IV203_037798 [Nitzschia inconspicua]
MRAPTTIAIFCFVSFVGYSMAFVGSKSSSTRIGSRLHILPSLQKFTDKGEYNKVVEGLMLTQGISREQAEKEYDAYLDNPTNYALEKGEAYYKSLGYKTLMEGVIGEAEKEGRGEEVRARIEKFQKESKMKGLATISVAIAFFFYLRITNPYVPPGSF